MKIFDFFSKEKQNSTDPMKEKVSRANLSVNEISQLLSEVIDPETGVNIVELGLIYNLKIENKNIFINMTMTTPACPMTGLLIDMTKDILYREFKNINIEIELVWQPTWSPQMMSENAKKQLGW